MFPAAFLVEWLCVVATCICMLCVVPEAKERIPTSITTYVIRSTYLLVLRQKIIIRCMRHIMRVHARHVESRQIRKGEFNLNKISRQKNSNWPEFPAKTSGLI